MEVWKESRILANRIYDATNTMSLARDFGLRDQMRRAAISILSNIAEGFERGGDREFFQFLAQAKGSAGELRSQLYLALDRGYLSPTEFNELCAFARRISRMISGMMTSFETRKCAALSMGA
ncbi:MAG: four helix bundle protein [Terriglobia bacterium]